LIIISGVVCLKQKSECAGSGYKNYFGILVLDKVLALIYTTGGINPAFYLNITPFHWKICFSKFLLD
jgi:hypothetical protein